LGDPPSLDRFIVTYTPPAQVAFPEDPDPWQIEFRWETAGPPRSEIWILDAWLQRLSEGGNLHVPATTPLPTLVPGGSPARFNQIIAVNPNAVPAPLPPPALESAAARLYRLHTSIRWQKRPLNARASWAEGSDR
jgi:hypothetical protein